MDPSLSASYRLHAVLVGLIRRTNPGFSGFCTVDYRRQIEGDIAEAAVDFIQRQTSAKQPFFLYVGWTHAHYPTLPSPEFTGKSRIGPYGDAIMELDHRTGQVLDAIKAAGVENDTIVLWLSDNAAAPTSGPFDSRPGSNGPFRGELGDALEGSIRTVGMIKWPGKIPASASNEIVSVHDIFPTLAGFIGARAPADRPMDGMDQIAATTKLGERPKDLKAWNSLPADQRRLFARQAEIFAGFLEQTDHEIGQFKKALEDIGEMENTLFIYIAGDNGTSAEGGFVGMYNEMTYFNGVAERVEDLIPLIDKWGGPETFPHMAAGWAVAFDAPFSWTKQVASDFGGTRNGVVIHWPKGIKEKGGLRSQFSHVIDVAPTILEAAGLPEPKIVNGTPQKPIEGTSLVYSFNDAKASERHTAQYFEMFGNRGIYHEGWFARTLHRAPWQTSGLQPLTADVWDLYDVRSDFSLTNNLAAKNPEKLKELQALFMKEAEKYNVLPIDDRTIERTNPQLTGRPDVLGDRQSLTLYEGMEGMLENTFMNIKNRSSKITAEIEAPAGVANGAILSQGGRFGGWSLYVKDGKPAYTYNFLGLARYTVQSPEALPSGPATVVLDFAYDGGGVGKGGQATLLVNGKPVAEGRVEKTQPNIFSADETADVGIDNQTPVALGIGIGAETRFTGKINEITLEVQ